jgi:ankyrin
VGLDGYASVLWNFNGNSFDSSHRVVENDHFEIVLASSEHHGVVQRAMNVACHLGHQLVVNLLLEWGGIVDTEAWVPAWISEGKTDLLRQYVTPEFLEGTRNSNLIDIETAARLGHTSTVQWGLSVKPEFLEDRNIQTRAFIAASRCGHDGTVKALLEVWPRGVDVLGQEDISPLIAAVKHSHLSTAALLLQHGADVNHEGSDGKSPLLVACERGSLEMVKLLLSHKGMLSAVDDDDNTALHYASGAGNWQLIQFLLEQGLKSQLKTRNKNLQTPLHLACEQPFIRSVSVLLEAGSLVSVVDKEGNSPLQEAVEQGHEMVVSQLLRYNAKWNDLPHSNDFEPLVQSLNSGILVAAAIETRWAIYENQVAGLKEMARSLKHEAQVVFDAVEAAHVAAQLGNVKALEVVLQAGADVQARNAQGQSPLHLACISGHPAVIKLLLDKGAKTDGVTAEGNLAWHLACSRGHTAVVKMLLSAVDINAVNQKGMSGLAFACWNGHVDVVTELLKHDVDTGGNDKPSPLLVATEHVHIPCVQALLNAKVNPLIKFEDENALHKASATSSVPLVKLLLTTSLKDHIDAHGISGMTPLMYAAGRGDEPIVITLQLMAKQQKT